jgi:hypothetical protein
MNRRELLAAGVAVLAAAALPLPELEEESHLGDFFGYRADLILALPRPPREWVPDELMIFLGRYPPGGWGGIRRLLI